MLLLLPDEVARHVASLIAFADLQAVACTSHEARASLYGALALEKTRLVLLPSKDLATRVVFSLSTHPHCRGLQRVSMVEASYIEMVHHQLPHVLSVTYTEQDMMQNSREDRDALVLRLSRLSYLRELRLYGVSSLDLAPLVAQRAQLQELYIQGSACVNNISILATFTDLRVLDLQGTAIEDITFVAKLTTLRSLNLKTRSSSINLEPLKSLHRLESLTIDAHELPNITVFDSFAATLKHLSCRDVTWSQGSVEWERLLQKMPGLVSLCGSDLNCSYETLASLKNLESLEINVPENAASLEALAMLPKLTSCTLYPKSRRDHLRLSRLSASALSRITSISIIDLADDDPSRTDDVGLCYRYLAKLPSLRHARFTGHPFCAKWVRLPRRLEQLELHFQGESWWGWDEFPQEILRNAQQLAVLSIQTVHSWSWDLSVLEKLQSLRSLQLS